MNRGRRGGGGSGRGRPAVAEAPARGRRGAARAPGDAPPQRGPARWARVVAAALAVLPHAVPAAQGLSGSRCLGRYAESLAAMGDAPRARESRPSAPWVVCLRASAVYEQISYGRGGQLRRQYHRKVRHGTGFAYRRLGQEALVATSQHVIAFPEVTGEGDELEGVPAGARRVQEEVRIVAGESDPDRPEQPVLRVVVADQALDVAVLGSAAPLAVMPYRLGRSAGLEVGDAVLVRGYPLGAFPAANAGTVIGVGQRDRERGWDHEDFAVDALLNLGSSGSPVFAVSCESGEPELVGIYHAGYRGAQGLNVVVAIDQLRPVLEELRTTPHPPAPPEPASDPAALRAAVERGPLEMPFGGRVVRVEADGAAIRYRLLDDGFPLSSRVDATLTDGGGGEDGPAPLVALRDALRAQLALVLAWRSADAAGTAADRDRWAALVRGRTGDQADLIEAFAAGGSASFTDSDRRSAAASSSTGAARDPHEASGLRLDRN